MTRWLILILGCVIGAAGGAVAVHLLDRPAPDEPIPAPAEPDMFARGTSAVFAGDYERAIELFEQIENQQPDSARMDAVLFWKAFALRSIGKPKEALALYERVEKEYPESPHAPEAALAAASIVEIDLKKPKEALARYKKVAKDHPQVDYKALANCGRVQEKLKEFEKASAHYEQAWSAGKNERKLPESNYTMRKARTRGEFLKKNLDKDRKALALYVEAEKLAEEGKVMDAVEKLKEIVETYPRSAVADDALALQVKLYRSRGFFDHAKAARKRLEQAYPDSEHLKPAPARKSK